MYMIYKNDRVPDLKYGYYTMCYIKLNTLSIQPYTTVLRQRSLMSPGWPEALWPQTQIPPPNFPSARIKGCVLSFPAICAHTPLLKVTT